MRGFSMSDGQSSNQWVQGVSGAVSSYYAGQIQKAGGEAEHAAYDYNAEMVLEQTKEEEQATQAKYSALSSRERSLYAKAGVSLTSGSPLLIAMNTAAQANKETSRIKFAGTAKAKLLQYYGDLAAWSGGVKGNATWLTGLSHMSSSMMQS
jgi:hypothetical protein